MYKASLGRWTFDSGNACHATIELTRPTGVVISFAWKSALSSSDRDRYTCQLLPQVLRLAVKALDELAQMAARGLELEAKGLLERVNCTEGEEIEWTLTEAGRAVLAASTGRTSLWSRILGNPLLDWLREQLPDA
jgi:hypothetical protein